MFTEHPFQLRSTSRRAANHCLGARIDHLIVHIWRRSTAASSAGPVMPWTLARRPAPRPLIRNRYRVPGARKREDEQLHRGYYRLSSLILLSHGGQMPVGTVTGTHGRHSGSGKEDKKILFLYRHLPMPVWPCSASYCRFMASSPCLCSPLASSEGGASIRNCFRMLQSAVVIF